MIPGNHIYLDTETTFTTLPDGNVEHTLKLGVAIYVCYDKNLKVKTRRVKHFTDTATIWRFIKSHTRQKAKLVVFAHNIFFDLWVSQIYLNAFKDGWKSKIPYSKGLVYIDTLRKDKAAIQLVNTGNFFKTTVRKLGKMLGFAKGKVDFDTVDTTELAIYCERDAEILEKAMLKWLTFIRSRDLGNFAFTLAGQAFNAYRHRFMTYPVALHRDNQPADMEKEAYYGGRCEAFYIGKIRKEKVYKLDINSMYPSVMLHNYFPNRFKYVKKSLSIHQLKKIIIRDAVVAKVKLTTDKPAYPKKIDNKLCFPVGTFETTLCTPELYYALQHNHIVEIGKTALYEQKPLFTNYVKELYALRQEFQKQGNEIFQYCAKIMLNSLYGKFGQRQREADIEKVEDNTLIASSIIINAQTRETSREVIFGGLKKITTLKETEAYHAFTAIAAHVTSYARVVLQETMDRLDREDYYYCDTDSLFVRESAIEKLKDLIDDKELGKWKIEEISDNVVIRGLKDYTFGNHTKLKGIRNLNDRTGINDYNVQVWPGFPLVFERHLDQPYVVKSGTKHICREYTKGNISSTGQVIPFCLS